METPATAPVPTDDEKKARKRERQKLAWQKWRHSAKGEEYFAKLKKPPQP